MADDVEVIYHRHLIEKYRDNKNKKRPSHNLEPNSHIKSSYANANATFQTCKRNPHCAWQNITVTIKQNARKHKRKKRNGLVQRLQLTEKESTRLTLDEYLKILTKKCSLPVMHHVDDTNPRAMRRRSDTQLNTSTPYQTKFIVNTASLHPDTLEPDRQHILQHPLMQAQLRIYRCQLSAAEESCCCSCNSDAMFEVMKSLYDCYKNKNCDHCNCVLCGHLPREERRLGEARKSATSVAVATESWKQLRKDNLKKAKEAGFLTPLAPKSQDQREKILRGLANLGLPLPEGKTPSLRTVIDKVRKELGLPPEPKSAAERGKHESAAKLGALFPMEGKTNPEKEKLLRNWHKMGIELPDGRTPSEKSLIARVRGIPKQRTPSQKSVNEKAAGTLTPLEGKTPEQKEKIIRGLALSGLLLPEVRTPSIRKLIDKVRKDLGLPPEPKTSSERQKHDDAAKLGTMFPLEGKSNSEKEKLLRNWHNNGIELPEGRSASEKSMIAKIKAGPKEPTVTLSKKSAKVKAAGLLTPLEGKTPEQKEKILRGLALSGLHLPEAKTPSLRTLIDKVRKDVGLPQEPKTSSERQKHDDAAKLGSMFPLEGKSNPEKEKLLRNWHNNGIELPGGRSASEKSMIEKFKAGSKEPTVTLSKKSAKVKAAGLLTPLEGKTPEQKEKILRGLALSGLPLPEAKTPSLRILIDKVRKDVGLPPEPKTSLERQKHSDAAKLVTMLRGKSNPEKEKLLQNWFDNGIELPEGRSPSEKSLLAKVKSGSKQAKSKAAGLLLSLSGKTPEDKEKIFRDLAQSGLPLPEGKTASDKKLINKIREEFKKVPLPSKIKKIQSDVKPIPSAAGGLLTTLDNKTPEQKENLLWGLAMIGMPLPEMKTPSDMKLLEKVRNDLGLPPEPKNSAEKEKYIKAQATGIIRPLEGKTLAEKEEILRALLDKSIPLPQGRTPSEKSLIKKILGDTKTVPSAEKIASDKLRKATVAGLPIPLQGKTSVQKEKILQEMAMNGAPLPDGNTPSEVKLIDKVRKDLGVSPTPKTAPEKEKYAKAHAAGLMMPLEGKTPERKEKILRKLAEKNIPLPEGRTPSEKSLIKKIQVEVKSITSKAKIASEKQRKATAAGLVSSLEGKSPEEKVQYLRNLGNRGLPLPEGKTASDKALIDKIKKNLEETAKAVKETKSQGIKPAIGIKSPLDGKSPSQKENILKKMLAAGVPLPEGRTASEKAIIAKIASKVPVETQSTKLRKAKAAGLLTPLKGKKSKEKEKILKGQLQAGLPLPEATNSSENVLIKKVKDEFDAAKKTRSAAALTPSQGKSVIREVSSEVPARTQSAKLRKAKAEGLLTPLKGKDPKTQEKILKGLLKAGVPLPKGTTPSEMALIKRVQDELDAAKKATSERFRPKSPAITDSIKQRQDKTAGLLSPLTGKTPKKQEKILKRLLKAGLPPPKGTTSAEKAMIKKITSEVKAAKKKTKGLTGAGLPVPEGGDTRSKRVKVKSKSQVSRKCKCTKTAAGIQEEVQTIFKTDKCDAACSCDKKKIRFKHSYVKIKVTSPDISSFCPCPNECIPKVKAGVFTDSEGIIVTVGSVGVPSYTLQPEIKPSTTHKNMCSLQWFDDINNLIQNQSHVSLKISLTGKDYNMDGSSSSKSTVYIFHSESDVTASDIIEHLLHSTFKSDSLKKDFVHKTHKEKQPISYIYRSRYVNSNRDVQSSPEKTPTASCTTLNSSTSSLRSICINGIYESESCLSLAGDRRLDYSFYSISDTISDTSQSTDSTQSYCDKVTESESNEYISVDLTVPKTMPRKRKLLANCNEEIVEYNSLIGSHHQHHHEQSFTEDKSCGSCGLMEKIQLPTNFTSKSLFMVFSISGFRMKDTHSEPSSHLFNKNRPDIGLLALDTLISAKLLSKATQKDWWKLRKDKAVLRARNMARKLIRSPKQFRRRRCSSPKDPLTTEITCTSSTTKGVCSVTPECLKTTNNFSSTMKRLCSKLPDIVTTTAHKCTSIIKTPEQKNVGHSLDQRMKFLPSKWKAWRGYRSYRNELIDKVQNFSSPSSYSASDSTCSTIPQRSQVHTTKKIPTPEPKLDETVDICAKAENAPKQRKICTFATSVGKLTKKSIAFSVHRMKTCY